LFGPRLLVLSAKIRPTPPSTQWEFAPTSLGSFFFLKSHQKHTTPLVTRFPLPLLSSVFFPQRFLPVFPPVLRPSPKCVSQFSPPPFNVSVVSLEIVPFFFWARRMFGVVFPGFPRCDYAQLFTFTVTSSLPSPLFTDWFPRPAVPPPPQIG